MGGCLERYVFGSQMNPARHLLLDLSLTASANPAQISSARSGSLVTEDYLCRQWLGLQHPKAAGDWQETGDEMKKTVLKSICQAQRAFCYHLKIWYQTN